nr:MAK10-like protein [Tanacetum cinerariifolium]
MFKAATMATCGWVGEAVATSGWWLRQRRRLVVVWKNHEFDCNKTKLQKPFGSENESYSDGYYRMSCVTYRILVTTEFDGKMWIYVLVVEDGVEYFLRSRSDENLRRTLGNYSRPSHEGYRNTIELLDGNNVAPLRSDTIWRTIDEAAGGKLRDKNAKESCALLEDFALYDNESCNDPRDFTKLVKAISFPQDVPSTSDRRLIGLENQVQRLMEAHLAPNQPVQVNKIASSCEICGGPHDTQYCMENLEQAFVDYASSCTDEAGGKWFTFKPEQNNLYPPNRFQPNGSFLNRSFNNNTQNSNNQSNLEGLVSNFMASQDARISRFEADFKQYQSEMTNKIDTFLKAINDRMTGSLSSDTVKNPKLNVKPTSISSARSYLMRDPQSFSNSFKSFNAIKTCFNPTINTQKDQLQVNTLTVKEVETPKPKEPALEDEFRDLHLNLPVLEVLAHVPMYENLLDKYIENLELGKMGPLSSKATCQ